MVIPRIAISSRPKYSVLQNYLFSNTFNYFFLISSAISQLGNENFPQKIIDKSAMVIPRIAISSRPKYSALQIYLFSNTFNYFFNIFRFKDEIFAKKSLTTEE
jgi:hypothetical protein